MTDAPRPRVLILTWAGVPRSWLDALPLAVPGFGAALRSALVADLPADPHQAAAWATLATGQPPGVHGVSARGERPAVPAFWDALDRSGLRAAVVGWPGSHPANAAGVATVTDAFAAATGADAAHWPLAPGCVEPAALRPALARCRVHPSDLSDERLAALGPGLSPEAADLLRGVVSRALTVRGAAAALARSGDADVIVVHWDAAARFAHGVLARATGAGPAPADWAGVRTASQGLLTLLASLAADVAAAAGALSHLVLLSSHGTTLPAAVPGGDADVARWALAPGWVAACGSGLAPAGRPVAADALDLAPTVLALACGTIPGGLPGLTLPERAAGMSVPRPEVTAPTPPRPRPAVWARPVTPPRPEAGVRVRAARDDEGDLIHRLLGSPAWEPGATRTAFVAESLSGQRVGAAVLSCVSWTGTPPGPPVRLGVLPTANRWVAAALAAAARREAAAWGMAAVYAHDPVEPGSEAAVRWAELGFEVCASVARFEAPCLALRSELAGLVEALRVRGRVPVDADVVPVADVPAEAVAALYRTELSDREAPAPLARRVRGGGRLGMDPRASAALVVDGTLAGVALTRDEGGGVGFVEAFVLAPAFRGTWAAPVLRLEALDRAIAAGFRTLQFDAGAEHHDTRKLAARIGAKCLWQRDRYRSPATPSP